MRRYLVFAGIYCEPEGGAHDLVGDYASLDDVVVAHVPLYHWAHVLDTETGEVINVPGVQREPCGQCSSVKIARMPVCDPVPGVTCEIVFRKGES